MSVGVGAGSAGSRPSLETLTRVAEQVADAGCTAPAAEMQEEALLLVVRQRHASKKASTTGGPVTEGVRDSTSVVSATADTEQESKEIADEAVTSDSDESTAAGRDADGQVDFDLDVDADAAATSRAWASGCLRTLRALRDVRAQQKDRVSGCGGSLSLVAMRSGKIAGCGCVRCKWGDAVDLPKPQS